MDLAAPWSAAAAVGVGLGLAFSGPVAEAALAAPCGLPEAALLPVTGSAEGGIVVAAAGDTTGMGRSWGS